MSWTFRLVSLLLLVLRRRRRDFGRPGVEGDTYLTRWVLLRLPRGRRLLLHRFHRSDEARALHDHPWPFTSLILWPGYYEVSLALGHPFVERVVYEPAPGPRRGATAGLAYRGRVLPDECGAVVDPMLNAPAFDPVVCGQPKEAHERAVLRGPLSLVRRAAQHQHRVELLKDWSRWPEARRRGCWTLVVTGPREREWGFWCSGRWTHWQTFNDRDAAGLDPCGEET